MGNWKTYKFGDRSTVQLEGCHVNLQRIAQRAIDESYIDFAITEGQREIARQRRLFLKGKSKIDGVTQLGRHNYRPALAFDFAPYPIDFQEEERFYVVAGALMAAAKSLKIAVRWGGDWDMDGTFRDQSFHDLGHLELVGGAVDFDARPLTLEDRLLSGVD